MQPKFLLVCCFLSVCSLSHSQVKYKKPVGSKPSQKITHNQTVNWIVDKFNTYTKDLHNYDGINRDYKLSFDSLNNHIVVKYERSNFAGNGTFYYTSYIPIKNIDEYSYYVSTATGKYEEYSYLTTKGKVIIEAEIFVWHENGRVGSSKKTTEDRINIPIQMHREDKLSERIIKAFAHLKTFYPDKKEEF